MPGEIFRFQWPGWRRFAYDFFIIQIGFLLFGLAVDILVQANLGLDSWDVLQMALTFHIPITLGQASIVVAFIIVLLDIIFREPLGWGTIANVIFIGVWVDALKPYVPSVPNLFLIQVAYLLLGTLVMGFATAIYVGVNAGAGPRDSLMLALSRLGKTSLRVARTCIEVTVVAVGWLLGGPAWLGTLIAAIAIGPAVQLGFKILRVRTREHLEDKTPNKLRQCDASQMPQDGGVGGARTYYGFEPRNVPTEQVGLFSASCFHFVARRTAVTLKGTGR